MKVDALKSLSTSFRDGKPNGIASICSAHPTVIRAALRRAKRKSQPVLIEATCNQVNQFGGYTGMTPSDFVAFVHDIAQQEDLDHSHIIFGGDHLGPNPWRKEPAESALKKANELVGAYVRAGFNKIHIDASMGCAGEAVALDNATVAQRAATLCKSAESAARIQGIAPPLYILGTEVPIPGGSGHALDHIAPTSADAARETIEIHRLAFEAAGLRDAFERVIAFVVQPGVEFGSENILPFAPTAAKDLSALLNEYPSLVFEAHSTDYQSLEALSALVGGGFSILKVGPELTFAYREALYQLDLLACAINDDYAQRPLMQEIEATMLDEPSNWRAYYRGTEQELKLQRHYSYSDRIRYYWNDPRAQNAVYRLIDTLNAADIAEPLRRQFLPQYPQTQSFRAETILLAAVDAVLARYDRATGATGR